MLAELFTKTYFGNTLLDWLTAFGIVLLSVVGGKILYWFFGSIVKKFTSKTQTKFDDVVIDMAEEPVVLAATLWGIEYGFSKLHFTKDIDKYIENGFDFCITLAIAWLIVRVLDGLTEEYVVPIVRKSENNLDDAVLPIVRRGLRMMIWVIAFIIALNNAGYDVAAFLAGLGIGGLAIAIAARNTVMNLIGGLTILISQPFKITDRIIIDKYDGIVTDIGLMNTVLRLYIDETVASIPNKMFTDKEVVNVSKARAKKAAYYITIANTTSPEKVYEFIEKVQAIFENSSLTESDSKVCVAEFSESGFKIEIIFYIKSAQNSWEAKAIIGTQIIEIVKNCGIAYGRMNLNYAG
jgi:MscS family membrane protein